MCAVLFGRAQVGKVFGCCCCACTQHSNYVKMNLFRNFARSAFYHEFHANRCAFFPHYLETPLNQTIFDHSSRDISSLHWLERCIFRSKLIICMHLLLAFSIKMSFKFIGIQSKSFAPFYQHHHCNHVEMDRIRWCSCGHNSHIDYTYSQSITCHCHFCFFPPCRYSNAHRRREKVYKLTHWTNQFDSIFIFVCLWAIRLYIEFIAYRHCYNKSFIQTVSFVCTWFPSRSFLQSPSFNKRPMDRQIKWCLTDFAHRK